MMLLRLRRLSVCSSFMFLLSIVSTSCSAENAVVFQKPVGKGPHEHSPKLPETGFALRFNLVPAKAPGGSTVGLFGAIRAGQPYADRYGGRLAGAVQVVAVDAVTGRIFHGVPERPETAPLSPLSDEEIARLQKGDAVLESIETYFHIDLFNHLGLPSGTPKWHVFMWLDDHLSDVVDMPGKGEDEPSQAVSPGSADLLLVKSAPLSDLQKLKPDSICLIKRDCAGSSPRSVKGLMRFGSTASDGVDKFSVLSLCQNSRQFHFATIDIPHSVKQTGGLEFDFSADAFGACGAMDERIFFVAVRGSVVSNVLTIFPGNR